MNGTFENLTVGAERARLYVSGTGPLRVAVLHAWWGLNDDAIAYADRLAAAGFSVVAPDLVRGRVASTIEDAERLVSEKVEDHADAVALAAIDRFAGPGTSTRVGLVGFSFGAAWAIWSATKRPAVAASVVYYGTIGGPSLAGPSVPVLGHFAESDPYEPGENIEAFERALRDAGRDLTVHRYAGTGHWFAEPSRDAWRPEAADLAFQRTVGFLREHLER